MDQQVLGFVGDTPRPQIRYRQSLILLPLCRVLWSNFDIMLVKDHLCCRGSCWSGVSLGTVALQGHMRISSTSIGNPSILVSRTSLTPVRVDTRVHNTAWTPNSESKPSAQALHSHSRSTPETPEDDPIRSGMPPQCGFCPKHSIHTTAWWERASASWEATKGCGTMEMCTGQSGSPGR